MDARLTPDDARFAVRKAFAELGLDQRQLAAMEESLLIDDGRCRARSYEAGGLRAMWMIDVRMIQFYGAKGEMLRTIDLMQGDQAVQQAARKAA